MKKQKILLIGAGAIGRGYLPWLIPAQEFELLFVDPNPNIINQMKSKGGYSTYRAKQGNYEEKQVAVTAAYTPDEFDIDTHPDIEACFFSVGPRNVSHAARLMKGSSVPLILCENEPGTVNDVKSVVAHEKVYFAVPDVITSNTAPRFLLDRDPLAVVTEDGVLFMEEGAVTFPGDFKLLSRTELLEMQWTPKLFLHNTPHCIAAYLGALTRVAYIHEAMDIPEVSVIVEGAMLEMLTSLKMKWEIPHDFLEWYAAKELSRFRNKLLFDPVARVAREPLRKLEVHGRLIGAAQICLSLGVMPQNILLGITAALLFDDQNDNDHHLAFLRCALPKDAFNTYILGLRRHEPLELLLSSQIDTIIARLKNISRERK